jgi:hypothetical protein
MADLFPSRVFASILRRFNENDFQCRPDITFQQVTGMSCSIVLTYNDVRMAFVLVIISHNEVAGQRNYYFGRIRDVEIKTVQPTAREAREIVVHVPAPRNPASENAAREFSILRPHVISALI